MPPKKDKEEEENSKSSGPKISFSDLEKSMMSFTGDDTYPISTWIQEFEDTAEVMEWSKIEKLIYGKRLLNGTAKLFLRSLGSVKDWEILKNSLKEEFGPKLNSAIIHKKLASRKKKNEETFQQYFLHMKELALHATVEDEALMEYVIDGIPDSETNKTILYGAKDIKEFRAKLDSYGNLRKRIETKNNIRHNNSSASGSSAVCTGRKKVTKRCFYCGDTDHLAPACIKGVKCFRCNEFGHKGNECSGQSKKTLGIQNQKEEVKAPFKNIKINGIEITALIDTGSDVNLIKTTTLKEFGEDKTKYENNPKICLTGIAKKKINTEGYFIAKLQIDDYFIDTTFHVVKDEVIPVNLILGNPILHDFNINFTLDTITVEKIAHLTLLTEEKNLHDDDLRIGDTMFSDNVKTMIKDYKLNETEKESNVEMRLMFTNETPIYQNPRRLPPLEKEIVNKPIKKAQEQDTHIEVIERILEREPYKDYAIENGSFQRSIGMTGVQMRNKDDDILKMIEEESIAIYNENISELRLKAKESVQKIKDKNRRSYNKNRKKADQYDIGDLVGIKRTQFTEGSKLYPNYLGPYEVVQKKRNERYVVKEVGHSEGPITTTSSADFMKRWMSPNSDTSGSDDEAG